MRVKYYYIFIMILIIQIPLQGGCFNIHKMIEFTSLYGNTLDFNKNIIFEKENIKVCKDFILIQDDDTAILKTIEKGNVLSELKGILGIDTLAHMYSRRKGIPIKNLISLNDTISLPSTFFFYTGYNEFIVFAEVVFKERYWKNGKGLKEYSN